MKKLMSVLILVAFIGSMVVMTGCFGGDSKGLFAALAIGLIITASGGTGGAVAFAANERATLRPASVNFSKAAKRINFRITPMTAAGKVGEGTKYTDDQLEVVNTDELKLNVSSYDVTSYNQYAIEVYADDNQILRSIGYLNPNEKSGTQEIKIDPQTTAAALLYDSWNTDSNKTYQQFDYNLDKAAVDLNKVASEVEKVATDIYNGVAGASLDSVKESDTLTTELAKVEKTAVYNVSGYVYAADGSGQSGCWVYVYSDEAMTQMVDHVETTSGNYNIVLPDGTYYFKPSKADHTYTPTSTKVVVNGAEVGGINFQAASTSSQQPCEDC